MTRLQSLWSEYIREGLKMKGNRHIQEIEPDTSVFGHTCLTLTMTRGANGGGFGCGLHDTSGKPQLSLTTRVLRVCCLTEPSSI